MDCKIISRLFLIIIFFTSTQLNAIEFKGKFLQGHYIVGITDPVAKIIIGKKEVRVSKDLILFDQSRDLITQEKQTVSVDGVNGPDIVLGSLSDVSTNGNWPTTFDFERK